MYYKSAHKARGACHVAHKANLKTKEPKKGGTSIRRRWIVVVASDRRIGLAVLNRRPKPPAMGPSGIAKYAWRNHEYHTGTW